MLNAGKRNSSQIPVMNSKYMVIIATMAVMLVGATTLATSESAHLQVVDMDTRRVMRRAKQPAKLMNVATDFTH